MGIVASGVVAATVDTFSTVTLVAGVSIILSPGLLSTSSSPDPTEMRFTIALGAPVATIGERVGAIVVATVALTVGGIVAAAVAFAVGGMVAAAGTTGVGAGRGAMLAGGSAHVPAGRL